jgi:hypothetical protein
MQASARTAAVALGAALLIAGCGGGGGHGTRTTSTSSREASVPTTATLTSPQTTTPTTATLTVPQTSTARTSTTTTNTSSARSSTTRTSTTRTSTTAPRRRRHRRGPTRAQLGAANCRRSVEQSGLLTSDEKAQLEVLCGYAWSGNRAGVAQAKRRLCETIVADAGIVGSEAAAEVASCEASGQPAHPIPGGGIPPGASFGLR